ncbi:hypothetical protein NSTCB13_02699 [Nostoc sp. DSM 114160]|jgi:hypothetical protein
MSEKPTTIHRQLLEILSQLPKSSQEEVLDFAKYLGINKFQVCSQD